MTALTRAQAHLDARLPEEGAEPVRCPTCGGDSYNCTEDADADGIYAYPADCNTCDGTTCPDCDADLDGDGLCECA